MKQINVGGSGNAACIPSAVKESEKVLGGRIQLRTLATAAYAYTRDPLHSTNPRGLGRVSDLPDECGDNFSASGPDDRTGQLFEADGIDPVYFQIHSYEQLSRGY